MSILDSFPSEIKTYEQLLVGLKSGKNIPASLSDFIDWRKTEECPLLLKPECVESFVFSMGKDILNMERPQIEKLKEELFLFIQDLNSHRLENFLLPQRKEIVGRVQIVYQFLQTETCRGKNLGRGFQ